MRFDEVVARLEVLPVRLPDGPSALTPQVLAEAGAAYQDPLHLEPMDTRLRGGPLTGRGEDPAMIRRVPWAPGPRRKAAALVLLYPGPDGQAYVILTERPSGDLRHAGEISLPGGVIEPTDASTADAALREAREEVGLDPVQAGVRVVGELSLVEIRVSGFDLTPVVALADRAPELTPDPREVSRILEAPVRAFLPGARVETVVEEHRGWRMRYGAYPVGGYRVWGATARVLGQLGALLGS